MTFRSTSRRAFTLIEVMIVIGIVGLVMTAGVPMMWKALAKDELAKAVHDILEGCKLARDNAILQNRPYDFVIRAAGENEFEMLVEPSKIRDPSGLAFPGSATASTKSAPGSLIGDFPRRLGKNVAFELLAVNFIDVVQQASASEARARFYQNGTSDDFTAVLVHNSNKRTITVDLITGAAYEVIK